MYVRTNCEDDDLSDVDESKVDSLVSSEFTFDVPIITRVVCDVIIRKKQAESK